MDVSGDKNPRIWEMGGGAVHWGVAGISLGCGGGKLGRK